VWTQVKLAQAPQGTNASASIAGGVPVAQLPGAAAAAGVHTPIPVLAAASRAVASAPTTPPPAAALAAEDAAAKTAAAAAAAAAHLAALPPFPPPPAAASKRFAEAFDEVIAESQRFWEALATAQGGEGSYYRKQYELRMMARTAGLSKQAERFVMDQKPTGDAFDALFNAAAPAAPAAVPTPAMAAAAPDTRITAFDDCDGLGDSFAEEEARVRQAQAHAAAAIDAARRAASRAGVETAALPAPAPVPAPAPAPVTPQEGAADAHPLQRRGRWSHTLEGFETLPQAEALEYAVGYINSFLQFRADRTVAAAAGRVGEHACPHCPNSLNKVLPRPTAMGVLCNRCGAAYKTTFTSAVQYLLKVLPTLDPPYEAVPLEYVQEVARTYSVTAAP